MKNPTSGNLSVMFNAIYAAQHPQNFLFNAQAVETSGNPLAHAILRGGLDAEVVRIFQTTIMKIC